MQHEMYNQAQITSSRQEFQKAAKCNIVSLKITARTTALDLVWATSRTSNLFYYEIFYLERRHRS